MDIVLASLLGAEPVVKRKDRISPLLNMGEEAGRWCNFPRGLTVLCSGWEALCMTDDSLAIIFLCPTTSAGSKLQPRNELDFFTSLFSLFLSNDTVTDSWRWTQLQSRRRSLGGLPALLLQQVRQWLSRLGTSGGGTLWCGRWNQQCRWGTVQGARTVSCEATVLQNTVSHRLSRRGWSCLKAGNVARRLVECWGWGKRPFIHWKNLLSWFTLSWSPVTPGLRLLCPDFVQRLL